MTDAFTLIVHFAEVFDVMETSKRISFDIARSDGVLSEACRPFGHRRDVSAGLSVVSPLFGYVNDVFALEKHRLKSIENHGAVSWRSCV